MVNKETMTGSWNELKGKAIKKWGKLSDDDFVGFKGNLLELKGKVQKLYGYTKEQVEKEFAELTRSESPKKNKSKRVA